MTKIARLLGLFKKAKYQFCQRINSSGLKQVNEDKDREERISNEIILEGFFEIHSVLGTSVTL
jgi:hypothetical protein